MVKAASGNFKEWTLPAGIDNHNYIHDKAIKITLPIPTPLTDADYGFTLGAVGVSFSEESPVGATLMITPDSNRTLVFFNIVREDTSGDTTIELTIATMDGYGVRDDDDDDKLYKWRTDAIRIDSGKTVTLTDAEPSKSVRIIPNNTGNEQVIILIKHPDKDYWGGVHVILNAPLQNSPGDAFITLKGVSVMTVALDSTWTDHGYTAYDSNRNDVGHLVPIIGVVDTSVEGECLLAYRINDGSGNPIVHEIRTVIVLGPQLILQQPPQLPPATAAKDIISTCHYLVRSCHHDCST